MMPHAATKKSLPLMQGPMAQLSNDKWLIRTSIQWSNHVSIAMCSDLQHPQVRLEPCDQPDKPHQRGFSLAKPPQIA